MIVQHPWASGLAYRNWRCSRPFSRHTHPFCTETHVCHEPTLGNDPAVAAVRACSSFATTAGNSVGKEVWPSRRRRACLARRQFVPQIIHLPYQADTTEVIAATGQAPCAEEWRHTLVDWATQTRHDERGRRTVHATGLARDGTCVWPAGTLQCLPW